MLTLLVSWAWLFASAGSVGGWVLHVLRPPEGWDRGTRFFVAMWLGVFLLPNLRVFAEVLNLTNTPLRYFQGTSSHPIQHEFYSWWSHVGLKLDL